jgi:hypothetical protein
MRNSLVGGTIGDGVMTVEEHVVPVYEGGHMQE